MRQWGGLSASVAISRLVAVVVNQGCDEICGRGGRNSRRTRDTRCTAKCRHTYIRVHFGVDGKLSTVDKCKLFDVVEDYFLDSCLNYSMIFHVDTDIKVNTF